MNETESVAKSMAPIFLVVNADSDIYWNRAADREDTGMHLCIIETRQLGPATTVRDRDQVFAHPARSSAILTVRRPIMLIPRKKAAYAARRARERRPRSKAPWTPIASAFMGRP